MLLIIKALLLIPAALGRDHSTAVEGQAVQLDMAENSVDDRYDGCREKMADLVETKLLNNELNKSPDFKTAWGKGKKRPKTPNEGLKENHKIAIYVYSDALVYEPFNSDTRSGKDPYKQNDYKWYSLYFLLTDAIQILKKTQKQCMLTYRRTNVEFNNRVLNTEVRFGSFASSSLRHNITHFGDKSCFIIYTCEGADVTEYSKLPHEKEVLIPPYEKFKITAVDEKGEQGDFKCETVFTLKSTGIRSDLNCALFKKPSKTKTKYYALNNVL